MDFEKTARNERNENTALILMLGELSGKLSRIIELLSQNNEKFKSDKIDLPKTKEKQLEIDNKKFYMPLSAEDYE